MRDRAHAVALVLIALVFALCAQRARAQPVLVSEKMGIRVESVRWGWSGDGLLPERTNPVVLLVGSEDRAVSGTCELEYPQDGSQVTRVVTPFSTTPGRVVPVETAICPARRCEWIRLTLSDGRRSASVLYSNQGGGISRPMPGLWESRTTVGVLAPLRPNVLKEKGDALEAPITTTSSWQQAFNFSFVGPPEQEYPLDSATIVGVDASSLPTGWLAYESLSVLVAREDDLIKADRRALDALATWVAAGGRLLVLVSAAGSRLRELLPPDSHACFEVAVTSPCRPGAELSSLLESAGLQVAQNPVAVRVCTVTEAGRRAGWTARWRVEGASEGDESGLLIEGPAGLGRVALLGADPSRLISVASDAGARALWRDATLPLLPHWSHSIQIDPNGLNMNWVAGSGEDSETATALRARLDSVTTTPSVGSGFFVITLVAMVVLVLAIGPPGRIVLKRRSWLSHNWLIALGCIGVACATGAIVPLALRSGRTAIGTSTLVDARCDDEGGLAQAWTTSIKGVFAGRPGEVDISTPTPLSWTRGISTAYKYQARGSRLAPLLLVYDPPGATQRDGMSLSPVAFSQWTFRAFLQQGVGAPPELDSLRLMTNESHGRGEFLVSGLPEGAKISGATLYEDELTHTLTVCPEDQGTTRLVREQQGNPRIALDAPGGRVEGQHRFWYESDSTMDRIKPEHAIPLARSRNASLETLSRNGRGVLLVLDINFTPTHPDDGTRSSVMTTHRMTLRAVLPRRAEHSHGETP